MKHSTTFLSTQFFVKIGIYIQVNISYLTLEGVDESKTQTKATVL